MTIDEAISEARRRVPADSASDRPFIEVRLQIDAEHTNCTISRDTFVQEPGVTDFYGWGTTPQQAIAAAVAAYEETLASHASDCALHNGPATKLRACDCK